MAMIYLPSQDAAEPRVKVNLVLVNVLVQLFTAQNFGYLYQLIVVVVAMEEWLLTEYLHRKNKVYLYTATV